jgi:D-alanine-D-alanine ligase
VKKKLKILALFDAIAPVPTDQDLSAELKTKEWKTEAHVLATLKELGHPTEHVAVFDNLDQLKQKMDVFKPDVIFNLCDQFRNNSAFDQNIVSFLELHGVPFTGCGSTGLTLCKHKAIAKKILGYHRIRTPEFAVVPRCQNPARPKRLRFPILVKPLKEEASVGISQASLVETDDDYRERVQFVHEKFDHDAIAEEYIEGRELYVSLLGNRRLQVFPIRELVFKEVPPDAPKIATFKAKWDEEYRKKWGLENRFAAGLDAAVAKEIAGIGKRIFGLLAIDGYARIDLRVTPDNKIYFIEANPNPMLASDEDFAQSALKDGIPYPKLIESILRLGLKTVRE